MRVEEEFWQWFQEHSSDLLTSGFGFGSKGRPILSELREKLDSIHHQIDLEFTAPAMEFGSEVSQEKPSIVFTTNGAVEAVPYVTRLVNFAPALEDWKIVPFRPRQDFRDGVSLQDHQLKPSQIHFHYEKLNNGAINLDLYCEEVEGLTKGKTKVLCHKLLELALGEFDLYHRIEEVRIHLMSDPQSPHLLPFAEIAEVVDSLKKLKV